MYTFYINLFLIYFLILIRIPKKAIIKEVTHDLLMKFPFLFGNISKTKITFNVIKNIKFTILLLYI